MCILIWSSQFTRTDKGETSRVVFAYMTDRSRSLELPFFRLFPKAAASASVATTKANTVSYYQKSAILFAKVKIFLPFFQDPYHRLRFHQGILGALSGSVHPL